MSFEEDLMGCVVMWSSNRQRDKDDDERDRPKPCKKELILGRLLDGKHKAIPTLKSGIRTTLRGENNSGQVTNGTTRVR